MSVHAIGVLHDVIHTETKLVLIFEVSEASLHPDKQAIWMVSLWLSKSSMAAYHRIVL
jgi:hypothetical protein